MIGYQEFVRAAQINDAIMEERGDGTVSWEEASRDLGLDMMGLLAFGFEFAGKQAPPGCDELFELLHLAFCYGAITTARAVRGVALADAA